MTSYNGISHDNDITHPPAAADPDQENVLTLSRALNFPLWRDGTLSIIRLFIKGLPQLAKAVRVRCSPTRISLCQSVPGGMYAMLHSSSMSTRRDSRLTCSLPILQACICIVSICDGLTERCVARTHAQLSAGPGRPQCDVSMCHGLTEKMAHNLSTV